MRPIVVLDSRFDKQVLLVAKDRQFSALMTEVDVWLKKVEAPIFARPLRAVQAVCMKGGFSLSLGEPLAERIKVWFDAQYGERLKVDMSLGYGPVVIQGDLYKMRSPLLFWGGRIVCIAGKVKQVGAVPTVNVLEFIDGFTDQRANDLKTSELQALQHEFTQRHKLFLDLRHLQSDDAFKVAQGDLKSAVDYMAEVKRPVTVGEVTAQGLAIAKGLNGTERVVASSAAFLTPGEKVSPVLAAAAR